MYRFDMLPYMQAHFEEILSKNPNANHPPDEATIAAYRNATNTFAILELAEEISVSRAADAPLANTHRTYERLATSKISSTTEVAYIVIPYRNHRLGHFLLHQA